MNEAQSTVAHERQCCCSKVHTIYKSHTCLDAFILLEWRSNSAAGKQANILTAHIYTKCFTWTIGDDNLLQWKKLFKLFNQPVICHTSLREGLNVKKSIQWLLTYLLRQQMVFTVFGCFEVKDGQTHCNMTQSVSEHQKNQTHTRRENNRERIWEKLQIELDSESTLHLEPQFMWHFSKRGWKEWLMTKNVEKSTWDFTKKISHDGLRSRLVLATLEIKVGNPIHFLNN